jgi:hypothetical protein
MLYRVLPSGLIRWPNGDVRALPGEVFDGFDTGASVTQHRIAKRWLRGYAGTYAPATGPDAEVTATGNTPPDEMHAFMREALEGAPLMQYRTSTERRRQYQPPTVDPDTEG